MERYEEEEGEKWEKINQVRQKEWERERRTVVDIRESKRKGENARDGRGAQRVAGGTNEERKTQFDINRELRNKGKMGCAQETFDFDHSGSLPLFPRRS